ncbi:MAG TPA: hypothetical protein VKO67_11390 [Smithellaceae bacterium]|nr:hypothetical protein [Smithellaceae bacterium]
MKSIVNPQVERIARKQFNNEQTPQLLFLKRLKEKVYEVSDCKITAYDNSINVDERLRIYAGGSAGGRRTN